MAGGGQTGAGTGSSSPAAKRFHLSLRLRIAALLVGLSVVLVGVMYAAQEFVVMPTFADIERTTAERNVSRCLQALDRDLQSISNSTNDWASWDDTYQYVVDHNDTYEVSNLVDESFTNAQLNLICFIDMERKIVWGEVRDDESLEKFDVPDLFAAIQEVAGPISTHKDVDDAKSGILVTSRGAILLASRPIITTKRQGPIRGSLIMGRFLNQQEIDDLADRTQAEVRLWAVGEPVMPSGARRIVEQEPLPEGTQIEVQDEHTLYAYRLIDDVYGKPALLLRVEMPRDITAQGRVASRVATVCSILGGGVTLVVIWFALQRGLVTPLRRIVAHLMHVGRSGDLKARLHMKRTDEIGMLAGEVDRMVQNLADYRKEVLDAAHRSGMEEVASEVLHNVGNAVNSASCSVETLRLQLESSKLSGFDRAAALLREQGPQAGEFFANDPRGPKLVEYLVSLNDVLHEEQVRDQAEVDRLFETIRHIREVITAQQSHHGQTQFRQEVELAQLIDEVLLLNHDQLQAHEIEVEVDLPPLPELSLNKSKITQVLVNLVRNAIQAMQNQPRGQRCLTMSARTVGESEIEIEVHDTGQGFDRAVREKLFMHGFTTKPSGNGFGLHYCANTVLGVGGRISGDSPGPGEGATFRVRLPDALPKAVATT